MRARLDAGDGRIHSFLLQSVGYHGASSRQNSRPLTNHSVLTEAPHGALETRG